MAYKHDLNEEPEIDISKINSAGLINLRVQSSWDSCSTYYRKGLFDELRNELTILWPEFYADASSDQIKDIQEIDRSIAEALQKKMKAIKIQSSHDWAINETKYKRSIYKKWLFLKTLEKSQGVGKAYRDPGQDDWE